jgi:DNA-binding transcriptional MerR regulator
MPVETNIPDKLYFRIGEVSKLTGVKPYVLRFWENEFPGLGPKKSGTGHRLYRKKDVHMVLDIKHLLYEKRYTIEGARKWLDARPKGEAARTAPDAPKGDVAPRNQAATTQGELFPPAPLPVDQIRAELQAILELLK